MKSPAFDEKNEVHLRKISPINANSIVSQAINARKFVQKRLKVKEKCSIYVSFESIPLQQGLRRV